MKNAAGGIDQRVLWLPLSLQDFLKSIGDFLRDSSLVCLGENKNAWCHRDPSRVRTALSGFGSLVSPVQGRESLCEAKDFGMRLEPAKVGFGD